MGSLWSEIFPADGAHRGEVGDLTLEKNSGGGDSGKWGYQTLQKVMTRAKTRIRMSLNGSTPLSLECDQEQHHGPDCDQDHE